MNIEVEVDDNFIEKMFNRHCRNKECVDCYCNVLISENYKNCYDKYVKTKFNKDIQDVLDNVINIIQ